MDRGYFVVGGICYSLLKMVRKMVHLVVVLWVLVVFRILVGSGMGCVSVIKCSSTLGVLGGSFRVVGVAEGCCMDVFCWTFSFRFVVFSFGLLFVMVKSCDAVVVFGRMNFGWLGSFVPCFLGGWFSTVYIWFLLFFLFCLWVTFLYVLFCSLCCQ